MTLYNIALRYIICVQAYLREKSLMDYMEESLRKHYEWAGKIDYAAKAPVRNREDLSIAYTPGVARPCEVIYENPEKIWELTGRHNLVAVITDGSAVLGLGDIGPEAALPVMEGKCVLFKSLGGVDAVPIDRKSTRLNSSH